MINGNIRMSQSQSDVQKIAGELVSFLADQYSQDYMTQGEIWIYGSSSKLCAQSTNDIDILIVQKTGHRHQDTFLKSPFGKQLDIEHTPISFLKNLIDNCHWYTRNWLCERTKLLTAVLLTDDHRLLYPIRELLSKPPKRVMQFLLTYYVGVCVRRDRRLHVSTERNLNNWLELFTYSQYSLHVLKMIGFTIPDAATNIYPVVEQFSIATLAQKSFKYLNEILSDCADELLNFLSFFSEQKIDYLYYHPNAEGLHYITEKGGRVIANNVMFGNPL